MSDKPDETDPKPTEPTAPPENPPAKPSTSPGTDKTVHSEEYLKPDSTKPR